MFDPASRYYKLETATLDVVDSDGQQRSVRYLRRRFIPQSDDATTLVEHAVVQGDRLDNVTARYLGDPEQFWRVCDANTTMHPGELTEEVGTIIKISLPTL